MLYFICFYAPISCVISFCAFCHTFIIPRNHIIIHKFYCVINYCTSVIKFPLSYSPYIHLQLVIIMFPDAERRVELIVILECFMLELILVKMSSILCL